MNVLEKSAHEGRVTWLGFVPHRARLEVDGAGASTLSLGFSGDEREVHGGLTRPSCSRVKMLHPMGTEIRNTRQLTLLSAEEMGEIAADLGLDALDPAWLGASVVVEGIPDLSHLPIGTRLQAPGGLTLTADLTNGPCTQVSKTIEGARPGHGKGFKAAAKGRRGITAWVERPGDLALGDRLSVFLPTQRAWRG